MKKIVGLTLIIALSLTITACSSKNETKENEEQKQEVKSNEPKKDEEYLVSKYFDLQKGESFEDIKSKLSKEGLTINDPGEFDAEAGYKKREVSFLDEKNELDLVFRDNRLGSKTFTYNSDDAKSTWFYSNYYDVLDNDNSSKESHGIWKDSIKEIPCDMEYDILAKIKEGL